MTRDHILIATLSTEPQAITRALDWLLAQGYPIGELAVIHTTGEAIRPSWTRLDEEMERGVYPGVLYRRVPIVGPGGPVADILTEADIGALLRTLYRTIRAARQIGQTIHLSISSGRKTMAAYAMVAAQLLFGEDDRVWHLVSTERWTGGEKAMHAGPDEASQMVSVPVLRWANAGTAAAILEQTEDPWEAIRRQQSFAQSEANRRRREFLEWYLTHTEREVAELLVRKGLNNKQLARRLAKSEQTVANQLTKIYRKFDEWREFPVPSESSAVSRAALIAEFAPYLEGKTEEKVTTQKRKKLG
jgi:CRISPR-associated protein Csx14